MAEYDNTNRGALFPNQRKTTSRHPDYTGRINVDGQDYWVSGWLNTVKQGPNAGNQFVSIMMGDKVEDTPAKPPGGFPKTNQVAGDRADTDTSAVTGDMGDPDYYDDDVPF